MLEGFSRRGTEASLDLAPLRTRLTGFAVRSEPITGFREGFGVSDRDQRVHGLTVETSLLDADAIALRVFGTYLRGRGRLGAPTVDGVFAGDLRSGTAWSGSAELALFSRRIEIRGELARTRFDRDLLGDEGPVRDGAWTLFVAVTPWLDATLLGAPFSTTISFEQREVGPRFESLANPLAPVDRALRQWRVETRWGGWDARVSFVREKDNVDDLPSLPRFRTDLFDADLRWSGAPAAADAAVWRRALGTPFFGLGWSRERLRPLRDIDPSGLVPIALFPFAEVVAPLLPALGVIPVVIGSPFGTPFDPAIAPFETAVLDDRKLYVSRFQLGTRYASWGVSASHIIRDDQDRTLRTPRRRTDLTSLDADWTIAERHRVSIGVQQQRDRERDARGFQTLTTQGRLGLDTELRPELRAGGDLTLSRTRDSGTTDLTIWSATSFVEWIVARPRGLAPGLQLTLSGTYQDFQDDARLDGNGNQYQLFLTATVWWERGR